MATHIAGGVTTLSRIVLLTRTDGVILGFTDHDSDITYGGQLYKAMDAGEMSGVTQVAGASVDNSEVYGLLVSSRITEQDLANGVYNNARYVLSMINRANLTQGAIVLQAGYLGEVEYGNLVYRAEVRGLGQILKQSIGDVISRDCRCQLGDAQCKVVLAGYTFARTVTGINASATGLAPAALLQVNAGGSSTGSWIADAYYTGGSTSTTAHAIVTTGVTNPAPTAVYQSWRYAFSPMTYTLPGFSPGQAYTLRIHMCELGYNTVGAREFSIFDTAGQTIAYNYDIYANSGNQYQANVLNCTVYANASGNIIVKFVAAVDAILLNGLEVYNLQQGNVSGGITFADTHPTGYYDHGTLTFTSGANNGLSYEVQTHLNVSGVAYIGLRTGTKGAIAVSDTLNAIAGCNYNFNTCAFKFSNAINFHGEPHLIGNNALIKVGR